MTVSRDPSHASPGIDGCGVEVSENRRRLVPTRELCHARIAEGLERPADLRPIRELD